MRTRELAAKLSPLTPDQLPNVEQARQIVREQRKAQDAAIRARVRERLSESLKTLEGKQAARREELGRRHQVLLVQHAAERLALGAAQHAERQKPFTGAAVRLFALIERVPGLRSILAPIIRNQALNPAQRQAQARESLRRRHERESAIHRRRLEVLAKLEARERKALRASLTRKLRLEETLRAKAAQERLDQFVANTKDITEPTLSTTFAAKATGKDGWKHRQEKLSEGRGVKHNRPPGYRLKRDDPS